MFEKCPTEIESKSVWPMCASHFSAHIHWAFEGWPPLSEYWTQLNTPWMLLSAHECLWVSVNAPWMWLSGMPLSEYWTPPECDWGAWMSLSEYWKPPECNWVQVNAFGWMWTPSECDWMHVNAFEWGLIALTIHKKHFWLLFMIDIVNHLWLLLLTIIMVPRGLNTTFLEQCFTSWWV